MNLLHLNHGNLRVSRRWVSGALALVLAGSLCAQDKKKEEVLAPTGPAPKHDLTGVWMLRSPPEMRAFTNFTFTKDDPELTELGKQKYAEAKSSNGGKYTLETTNDPVLRRCAPPGTPRVYFHPYPFEFVNAGKEILQIFEYDHTIRRMFADGRPVPSDPDLTWMGTSVGSVGKRYYVHGSNGRSGLNDRTCGWIAAGINIVRSSR